MAPHPKQLDDLELIGRYRATGGHEFISELYNRYVHLVYGVCRKYLQHDEDARDASIEVFEQMLSKLRQHEVTYFKSWLYSVAKNHCLMKLRKRVSHTDLVDDIGEIVESQQVLHPDEVPHEEMLQEMEAQLQTLNPDQRRCLELFFLQGKSYQQIMLETGFDFKQVKSHIQNGKRNLRIAMEKAYEQRNG